MFDDFYHFSGLRPNLQESSIFFRGISEEVAMSLKDVLPIPMSSLPVEYLGIPLISTRLKAIDCEILQDKSLGCILSWSNKVLTHGGRVQLIFSMLYSVQVFWSQIFVLPQKVTKAIESKLMAFFWSGSELNHKCTKVKWANVCAPKEEGGLKFRRLKDFNAGTMCKHLWDLSKKTDSLWIKWVHTYIIKGQNMWHMVVPADCSWTIRKIFQLRE
ncbi:hypothetical protein RHMOL_Rhmol13G0244400 [Rhododendron molle]|uniref:Uncharacterized protein n=1 Tax=Rhododendron molle TaxID=49168 RepID=A0ACC0LBJ9_RHOML|nr:hypothetical protein RHMOL_Rhmol13G0244400 [Rhododendron molle]